MDQSESILIEDDEYSFNEKLNKILKARNRKKTRECFAPTSKGEGIMEKLNYLFKKEKFLASKEIEFIQNWSNDSPIIEGPPENGRTLSKAKGLPESGCGILMAAEIYSRNNLFPRPWPFTSRC